jgi:hypothetical protein
VLWGLGGALISGAHEALLYDGLAAAGARGQYARVNGWVVAAGLIADLPAAVAATVLFAVGGFTLVGWASVGVCLAAAAVASRLNELPRGAVDLPDDTEDADGADSRLGYVATLRTGIREVACRPGVAGVLVAVALLGGFHALEE